MHCRECGATVAESAEYCVNCGRRPHAGSAFCGACGAPSAQGDVTCSRCGARLRGFMPRASGGLVPDLRASIAWIFEEPNWMRTYVIGVVLGLIPIVFFMPMGYSLLVLHDAAEGRPPRLRDWDGLWGRTFVLGLKAALLALCYLLPFLLIGLIVALGAGVFSGHPGLAILAIFYAVILMIGFSLVAPLAFTRMVLHDSVMAGLALVEILEALRRAGPGYYAVWGITLGVFTAFAILSEIPILGPIISIVGGFGLSLWWSTIWGAVCGPILRPSETAGTPPAPIA